MYANILKGHLELLCKMCSKKWVNKLYFRVGEWLLYAFRNGLYYFHYVYHVNFQCQENLQILIHCVVWTLLVWLWCIQESLKLLIQGKHSSTSIFWGVYVLIEIICINFNFVKFYNGLLVLWLELNCNYLAVTF